MKLISWNCNGALRKKTANLSEFDADIIVVQECEDPSRVNDPVYHNWAKNYLWIGDNKNKGLGIFAKEEIELRKNDWSNIYNDRDVKYFLPCRINNEFNIIGIWAHRNNSPTFGYIGQLWKYLQINKSKFEDSILIGDFNSNVFWDRWDRWWNHSNVVEELQQINIESLYHIFFDEEQGKETIPTFYLHRKIEKPYHIDYIFSSKKFTTRLTNFEIGKKETWLKESDHLPIICELNYDLRK